MRIRVPNQRPNQRPNQDGTETHPPPFHFSFHVRAGSLPAELIPAGRLGGRTERHTEAANARVVRDVPDSLAGSLGQYPDVGFGKTRSVR